MGGSMRSTCSCFAIFALLLRSGAVRIGGGPDAPDESEEGPSLSRARTLEASEYRIRDCTAIRGQLTPQLNQRGGAARANKDREGGGEQGRTGTAGAGRGRAAAAPGHGECRPAFPLRRLRTRRVYVERKRRRRRGVARRRRIDT